MLPTIMETGSYATFRIVCPSPILVNFGGSIRQKHGQRSTCRCAFRFFLVSLTEVFGWMWPIRDIRIGGFRQEKIA
jgi:hypothetical protein